MSFLLLFLSQFWQVILLILGGLAFIVRLRYKAKQEVRRDLEKEVSDVKNKWSEIDNDGRDFDTAIDRLRKH